MKRALLVGLIVSAGAASCGLHRKRIPPAESHPFVAPSPVAGAPGLSVCWVETARRFGFTASGLLIRHPQGHLLVDTGNSSHFRAEVKEVEGFWHRRWLNAFPGGLKPKKKLGDVLAAIGEDPARLSFVLLTHSHIDHAGGLMDLPDEHVRVPQAEIDFLEGQAHGIAYVPAQAQRLKPELEPLVLEDHPYENFDRSLDVFGDGTVVVVPLPGHTPGSVGVFVSVDPAHRLVHVGDAVNDPKGYLKRTEKPFFNLPTDFDRAQADRTVARLNQLHQDDPSLLILPAHDRGSWIQFFGRPGSCVDATSATAPRSGG